MYSNLIGSFPPEFERVTGLTNLESDSTIKLFRDRAWGGAGGAGAPNLCEIKIIVVEIHFQK